jgi:hypothetical protein
VTISGGLRGDPAARNRGERGVAGGAVGAEKKRGRGKSGRRRGGTLLEGRDGETAEGGGSRQRGQHGWKEFEIRNNFD